MQKEKIMSKKALLLYTPRAQKDSHRLERAVATVVPPEAIEIVHTPVDLGYRLTRLNNGFMVAVMMAAAGEELEELLALGLILERLRIILVIPDAEPRTISRGHILRPRYISYIDSDFQDVAAVLGKILGGVPERGLAD